VAKEVTLVGVKVLDSEGGGANSGVINGIEYVLQQALQGNGPSVCNLSLGGGFSRALNSAVAELVERGKVFTAVAAGNEDVDACNSSPAAASLGSDVVSVGAIDNSDRRASFSNFGSCVTVFAPGVDIESTWFTNDVAINTISGTSMASPHVAGFGALYLESFPDATPNDVKVALTSGAVTDAVFDTQGSPNLLLNTESLFESVPQSPPASQAAAFRYAHTVLTVSAILLSVLL
jgi:subtilisin family serine protease